MNAITQRLNNEIWSLPYDRLMEILERDALDKIEGMSREELNFMYEKVMEERMRNCDINRIAEQTDEENHECIRLNVLQNAVIDKSKDMMFAENHPDLYHAITTMNLSFKDVEQVLSGTKVVNDELLNYIPSFDEVIEYMQFMLVEESRKQYAG